MGKDLPNLAKEHDTNLSPGVGGGLFVEGVSPSMRGVEAVIRELAQSDVPVLLLAESGAGKRTTAQRIHEMSRRRKHPFRILACSEMEPEQLVVPATNGNGTLSQGTVFLQEVAALSQECQARLLNALAHEERATSPTMGARLICGSCRDLEQEVRAGRLREDLYYRISGVCLRLPPLRQRKEDIPLLLEHWMQRYARDFRRPVPELSAETKALFLAYSWPGNLRELEDAAKALVALGDESVAMGGLRARLRRPQRSGNGGRVSLKQAAREASREAEHDLILSALARTRWNRRRAAAELQISYKTLLYKLKQIGYSEHEAS
jgi:two-component system response regulator AtoC